MTNDTAIIGRIPHLFNNLARKMDVMAAGPEWM
jgi:hypothetical protein